MPDVCGTRELVYMKVKRVFYEIGHFDLRNAPKQAASNAYYENE
jgi:hypothetical protein